MLSQQEETRTKSSQQKHRQMVYLNKASNADKISIQVLQRQQCNNKSGDKLFSPSNHPTRNAASAKRKARKQTKNVWVLVK